MICNGDIVGIANSMMWFSSKNGMGGVLKNCVLGGKTMIDQVDIGAPYQIEPMQSETKVI